MKFYDPWCIVSLETIAVVLGLLGVVILILLIVWLINNIF